MKTIFRILASAAAFGLCAAHASVSLSAAPQRVETGDTVTVEVRFTGTGEALLSSPAVPGMAALSGNPSASSFTEQAARTVESVDASGARSVTQTFTWRVVPNRPGTYALGPVAANGETSSGVTVTVEPSGKPVVPVPSPAKPGDERVPAEGLELAAGDAARPTGIFARWARDAQKNPLPWVAGVCAAALAWLALRTYSFLKKLEDLAIPEAAAPGAPAGPADVAELADGAPFADQAVALVRQRISAAVGRDLSHLATAELAELEPSDAKRALVREALRLTDAVRFGKQVGIEDEVRKLLKEYLA